MVETETKTYRTYKYTFDELATELELLGEVIEAFIPTGKPKQLTIKTKEDIE